MFSPQHVIATERRLGLEGRFRWFVRAAWPVLEPKREFLPGWHIDCVSEHIEAMHTREIRRLAANMPPGHMKSLLFCVLYNVWAWIRKPEESFMYGSNDLSLPVRDGGKVISLIQSDWFRERWGDRLFLTTEKDPTKEEPAPAGGTIFTSARSYRLSVAPGGKGVGRHAGVRIVDDGNKPNEMDGKAAKKVQAWLSNTFLMRVAAGEVDTVAVVMQRLGMNDLTQYVLELGGWEHLSLSFDYDPKRSRVAVGAPDPRTVEGQILWSPPHTPETREKLRLDAQSDFNWQTQYNQNPRPKAGPVFNADWLDATWAEVPADAYVFWVWDLAFEGDEDSDFVVGQAWAVTQAKACLLRMIRGQFTFSETKDMIREGLTVIPADIYIERKANGHAAINELEQEFPGVQSITPKESKYQRAMSVQALVQSGSVELPRCELPESVPHSMRYLRGELVAFPNGQNDDAVDVFVHALRVWRERRVTAADAYDQAKRQGVDLEAVFGRLLG